MPRLSADMAAELSTPADPNIGFLCYSYDLPDIPAHPSAKMYITSFRFEDAAFFAGFQLVLATIYPREGVGGGPEHVRWTDLKQLPGLQDIADGVCDEAFPLVNFDFGMRRFLDGSVSYQPGATVALESCFKSSFPGPPALTLNFRQIWYQPLTTSNTIIVTEEVLTYGWSEVGSFAWTVFSFVSGSIIGLLFKTSAPPVPRWYNDPLKDVLKKPEIAQTSI